MEQQEILINCYKPPPSLSGDSAAHLKPSSSLLNHTWQPCYSSLFSSALCSVLLPVHYFLQLHIPHGSIGFQTKKKLTRILSLSSLRKTVISTATQSAFTEACFSFFFPFLLFLGKGIFVCKENKGQWCQNTVSSFSLTFTTPLKLAEHQ